MNNIQCSIYDIKTRLCKDNSIVTKLELEFIDLDSNTLSYFNKLQLSDKNKNREIGVKLE